MKFRVTMKTPDALEQTIEEVEDQLTVRGKSISDVQDLCEKWFKYGESLTVEIDTEAQTCVVVPCKE